MLVSLGLLALGIVLLTAGGDTLVRGASALGRRFGLSPLISGLTIVAFGTSAPELAVSLQAALSGATGLAVGNVVGSNICNIALILGLAAVIRPLSAEARLVRLDVPIMIGVTVLLILGLLDGALSRLEGIGLTVGLLAYIFFTVRGAKTAKASVDAAFESALPKAPPQMGLSLVLLIAGLALLTAGSTVFVNGAVALATLLNVPPAIVGLTIVAIGTSLPEIATSVVAAARGHTDMAVGNIVGSNIFNILGILGITATIEPVAGGAVGRLDLGTMLAVSLLLLPLARSGGKIDRPEGFLLLSAYGAYMLWIIL